MMKKPLAVAITKIVVVALIFSLAITMWISSFSSAWFISNNHLDADSSSIYAVNQGYSGEILPDDMLQRVYPSKDRTTETIMVPGDLVYYSFIFQISVEDIEAGKNNYSVEFNMTASSYGSSGEVGESGDYHEFLSHCVIQENTCMLSVMKRGGGSSSGQAEGDSSGEVEYFYEPVSYVYVGSGGAAGSSGTYRKAVSGDSGTIARFVHTTNGAVLSNGEVNSFISGDTDDTIGAKFDLGLPLSAFIDYPTIEDGGKEYVCFMLYIPIWYRDTGENQNVEMNSQLTISGCTLMPLD